MQRFVSVWDNIRFQDGNVIVCLLRVGFERRMSSLAFLLSWAHEEETIAASHDTPQQVV